MCFSKRITTKGYETELERLPEIPVNFLPYRELPFAEVHTINLV
jgi:hypothetical protein